MGNIYTNPPQSRNEAILRATIDGTEYTDPPESRIEDLLLELKEAIEEGGGGGGTTVVPNPTGEPTDDLNTVKIGSTIYDIPEGTEVVANPERTAEETLTKLQVGDEIYSVPQGGGGTSDYTDLENKPQINGNTLAGNKTGANLGLVDAEQGKGLSTNDFTDELETKLNGIAAGAQVNAIESITLNGSTISPDANKNVALTVITNAVDNLVNYYLKTETYSKTEVDTIAANIKNSRMEVVSSLPTTDIQTNVIYLVPKSSPDTGDGYDEYINLDGTTSGWELIGNTDIDLSGYVTTSELNTALTSYVTSSDLSTTLSSYATTAAAFLTSDTAETTLDDADTFPFYDTSATAKKKGLLSTLKAFLKTYFDGIYSTFSGSYNDLTDKPTIPDVSGKADISAIGTNETGATASKAYAVGEHFYKNGKFCTCIQAIAQGAQFTLNTNYVEGTVAETLGGYKVVYTTTQAKYADKMQELKTAWSGLSKNDKLRAIIVLLYQGEPSHVHQQMGYGSAFIATGNVSGPNKILRFDVCDIANYTYFRVTINNTALSFEDLTNTSDNSQVYQLLVLN